MDGEQSSQMSGRGRGNTSSPYKCPAHWAWVSCHHPDFRKEPLLFYSTANFVSSQEGPTVEGGVE